MQTGRLTGRPPAADDQEAGHQDDGKDRGRQDAALDVPVVRARAEAHQRRTESAAGVPGQGQEREQRRATPGHPGRSDADGARPHDADGQAADHAGSQADDGDGSERRHEIGDGAKDARPGHIRSQVQVLPLLAIPPPAQAHAESKAAGPGQVADGLVHAQAGLREGRSPLRHGALRGAGGHHQDQEDPELPVTEQLPHAHALGILHDGLDRTGGEIKDIIERNQRPDTGQHTPVVQAEEPEEEGRTQDDPHGAPAVERMEQAHHPLLVGERTGLDDGTAQDLDQAATHGIHGHAEEDPHHWIGEQLRQERQAGEPQGRGDLRQDDAPAVIDVPELGAQEIRDQLDNIEDGRDQRQAGNRHIILAVESDEQQRDEIGHDGLRHETQVAGGLGFAVILHGLEKSAAR